MSIYLETMFTKTSSDDLNHVHILREQLERFQSLSTSYLIKKGVSDYLCVIHGGMSVLQIRTGQRSFTANLLPLTAHIYYVMIIVTGGFTKKYFFIIFRSRCY